MTLDRSKFKVTRDILPTISGWLLVVPYVQPYIKYVKMRVFFLIDKYVYVRDELLYEMR